MLLVQAVSVTVTNPDDIDPLVPCRMFVIPVPADPIMIFPAVTFSAVFVVPPDAVSVRAMLVLLDTNARVLENVAAVEVVDEAPLEPARDTFKAMGEVALVLPVTWISTIFPVVRVDDAR